MLFQLKNIGFGSAVVIAITFILFTVALFVKGFTHDLLLEAAVFLVSVKLIILSYNTSKSVSAIDEKLNLILETEINMENSIVKLQKPKGEK